MFVVVLDKPLAGVASTVFAFYTEAEAEEFQSCIHSKHEAAQTTLHVAGEPTEVFESWSF